MISTLTSRPDPHRPPSMLSCAKAFLRSHAYFHNVAVGYFCALNSHTSSSEMGIIGSLSDPVQEARQGHMRGGAFGTRLLSSTAAIGVIRTRNRDTHLLHREQVGGAMV